MFEKARMAYTGGIKIEQVKFSGHLSTIMRSLNSKDGDLLSHFDNIDTTEKGINVSSIKQMLINNQIEANSGKNKRQLPLEHIFGFCKIFKKIT